MAMKPNKPIYLGSWQYADTIREQLAGPIGEGQVIWDNNDYFEGFFHLSYAHINGPCYAAEGKFIFADKSYIEKAWLVTSSDRNTFNLTGIFRVHRPEGIDSIALFRLGKRYSVELFLADKPYAIEWYADEQVQRLEVASYELNEDDPNCISVSITLQDGRRIVQKGGKYSFNNYGERYYDPDTQVTIFDPNN